jgi:DNA repair exonuclease SbcCD nuclease subunit
MKFLVTSDWHADWSTLGVSRYSDVENAVSETVHAAIEHQVDAYVFAGDLTDPDSGPAVFDAMALAGNTAARLRQANIPSLWIPGNHDVIEDGTGRTTLRASLQPLRMFSGVHLFEQPGTHRVLSRTGDCAFHVVLLPFTATSHRYDPAAFVRQTTSDLEQFIVVGHLQIPGMHPGEETNEMPRGRDIPFPIEECTDAVARFNGHYHRQQYVERGGIHIPGSLARLTFGEVDHKPGYLIVEV